LSLQDKPNQANRLLAVVASMYSFGEQHGLVPEGCNPAARIERFPEARRERFLTTEELARLGEAFRHFESDGRFGAAIAALRLLLFTGARLREILHLRWEHTDLERGLLLLPDSKTGRKAITLNAPALAVLQSFERVGPFVIPSANVNRLRILTPDRRPKLTPHDPVLFTALGSVSRAASLGLFLCSTGRLFLRPDRLHFARRAQALSRMTRSVTGESRRGASWTVASTARC
jgi:integrase